MAQKMLESFLMRCAMRSMRQPTTGLLQVEVDICLQLCIGSELVLVGRLHVVFST